MAKKMTVDQNLCVGCGACASLCPESFKINDEGKSEFVDGVEVACDSTTVVNSCPVGAIKEEE